MTSYSPLIPGMEPGLSVELACMEEMNGPPLLRVMMKIREDHGGSQDEFPGDAEDGCRMTGERAQKPQGLHPRAWRAGTTPSTGQML